MSDFLLNLSDEIIIGDPCYFNDCMFATKSVSILPGDWYGFVDYRDEGDWGVRVSRMGIRNGHREAFHRVVASLGVDSGQMMIIDAQAANEWDLNDDWSGDIIDEKYSDSLTYMGACYATLNTGDQAGTLANKALVSSTGFGDGTYPLILSYDMSDEVCAVIVDFIWDEEDE